MTAGTDTRGRRLHPAWWTAILLVVIAALAAATVLMYTGALKPTVPVTLASDRAGLIMERGARVSMNGVQVGRVAAVRSAAGRNVYLELDIDSDQVRHIPANVGAQIRATTAFGAKYVDLTYPDKPSSTPLAAGAVLTSRNVTSEVNTVFESLVSVLDRVDPAKINAVLAAFSEALQGQGERVGEAISAANTVLLEVNSRNETIRRNWQALSRFSSTYEAAAQDITGVLDAATVTGNTLSTHAADLDQLLLNVIGFAREGDDLLAPNAQNLIDAVNILEPTTNLLYQHDPALTCTLLGAKWTYDNGAAAAIGGDGRTFISDATLLLGKDKYNFPDNLPKVAAKGGPGGKPGCGSLPDASKRWPVRQLITNTGWGTGMDIRPNPGVAAETCYVNFLPVTRAVPEPPSIRKCLPGPAVGPVTAPGMPPYGAALYGPGGEPLWPGLPPAGVPSPVVVPGTPVPPGKLPLGTPPVVGALPPPTAVTEQPAP